MAQNYQLLQYRNTMPPFRGANPTNPMYLSEELLTLFKNTCRGILPDISGMENVKHMSVIFFRR